MRSVRGAIAALLIPIVICFCTTTALAAFTFTTTTDKPTYARGETLLISITAFNNADTAAGFSFSTSMQADYKLDDGYQFGPDHAWLMVLTGVSIPAHDFHTWTYTHPWTHDNITPGTHTVIGQVVGQPWTAPATFTVTNPEPGAIWSVAILLTWGTRRPGRAPRHIGH